MAALAPSESLVNVPAVGGTATDAARRVERVLLLRTIVVTVVLGLSLWVLARGDTPARAAVWLQSSIIAATYATTIVFALALRRGAKLRRVTRPMFGTDVALTSLLVYATGGAQSPYFFLYALSIVSAGALSYRKGAFTLTVASIASLVLVAVLAKLHVFALPMPAHIAPWEQAPIDLGRTLGVDAAALFGVGGLAYIFGDQLQRGAETQRRADDIVRSLSSGLITINSDGLVLTANEAALEILRRPAELVGRPIDVAMPGLAAAITKAGGELRRADLRIPAAGDELIVGVSVSPLRDAQDRIIGRVINFQDLTDLRRLEINVQRAERLATVGHLAAGVAHEIRNPLASISGSIELLRQLPQASEDDRTLMTIVHREIQRLNVLIGDLLDYANPKPKQPVEFDLGTLVDETLQVARADQAFGEIELEQDIAKPLQINADPAKIRQVVWNLVRNAADAARTGGKHVRVEVRTLDRRAEIVVADDGPGIAQELLGRIFDPFFTTKEKGTGLGLATTHALVAEHGGDIDVTSEAGRGTKFVVRLPR